MKRFAILLATFGFVRVAAADETTPAPPSMDPSDALNPVSIVQGPGIKIGEGTVLHPQVGVETGVVSNVFYDSSNPIAAGLMRFIFEFGTSSLSAQRLANGGQADSDADDHGVASFSANGFLSYDQYLSSNSDVTSQGGFGGGLLLRGALNPGKPLSLSALDIYQRLIRPTNFESNSNTDRDVNSFNLRFSYIPPGRSLSGYLYYNQLIDVFEAQNQEFANRWQNTLGARVNWQWLPLTRLYLDVSEGVVTGLGDLSKKITSYPLNLIAGLQTALTVNTTLIVRAGYTQGFYVSGPDFQAPVFGAQLGYRYSPVGHLTAIYSYIHEDSINANYYRDHMVGLYEEQDFAPFSIYGGGELRFREYSGVNVVMGPPTRDDTLWSVVIGARYSFRSWIAAVVNYHLTIDSTDYRYMDGGATIDPSYVRHEVMAGVRAAY